jgi:hypothetical protein
MLFVPTKGQFDRIVAEGLSDVESPLSLSKIAINIRSRMLANGG